MSRHSGYWLGALFVGLTMLPSPLAAQTGLPFPVHGFTGTMALPDNIDEFYSGVNKALVKASEGIDRIGDATKDRKVHEAASLDGLQPGATVVVHYMVKGIQTSADEISVAGVTPNEATVTRVDRTSERITITFANGTTERLRLARYGVADSEERPRRVNRVIVYHSDDVGHRTARYFKLSNR